MFFLIIFEVVLDIAVGILCSDVVVSVVDRVDSVIPIGSVDIDECGIKIMDVSCVISDWSVVVVEGTIFVMVVIIDDVVEVVVTVNGVDVIDAVIIDICRRFCCCRRDSTSLCYCGFYHRKYFSMVVAFLVVIVALEDRFVVVIVVEGFVVVLVEFLDGYFFLVF